MVDGKPHDVVANPAGVFSAEKTRTLIGHLTKLAETQGRIFGGLPYRKFVYFYLFRRAEASAPVLEHQNSFVALMDAGAQALPEAMVAQASHEFFHVWNVKRIRPVEMWPYDYSRENVTPLLWVSEGFTNYYTGLALYRAGFKDARNFVDEVARGIAEVEGNEARRYISASDSSTSTWIGYASRATVQHLLLFTGAEHGRTPGPLHSSRHRRRIGSGRCHARALHGFLPAWPRIQHGGSDSRGQPNHQEVVRKLLQPVCLGHRGSAVRYDFRLRRLSGRTRHTKVSLSGCEPG